MANTKSSKKAENGLTTEVAREDYNLPRSKLKIAMPEVKPPKDQSKENETQTNNKQKNSNDT